MLANAELTVEVYVDGVARGVFTVFEVAEADVFARRYYDASPSQFVLLVMFSYVCVTMKVFGILAAETYEPTCFTCENFGFCQSAISQTRLNAIGIKGQAQLGRGSVGSYRLMSQDFELFFILLNDNQLFAHQPLASFNEAKKELVFAD